MFTATFSGSPLAILDLTAYLEAQGWSNGVEFSTSEDGHPVSSSLTTEEPICALCAATYMARCEKER